MHPARCRQSPRSFPKLIHMVYIRNAIYGGNEGSFDDCLDTYIADAKSQFIVSPPILDYNFMSRYENFIEETHEIEFISKRQNAAGQVAAATFNLKIFLTVYIGEAALSRLTGQTLWARPQRLDTSDWRNVPAVPPPVNTPSPAPATAVARGSRPDVCPSTRSADPLPAGATGQVFNRCKLPALPDHRQRTRRHREFAGCRPR